MEAAEAKVAKAKAAVKNAANEEEKAAAQSRLEEAKEALKAKKAETKEMVKTTEKNAKAELDAWKALVK